MRALMSMTIGVVALSLVPSSCASAQEAPQPTGHWEGVVKLPNQDLRIAVDITRNAKGELSGTFGQPDDGVKGLPFTTVSMQDKVVRLVLKTATGVSTFDGQLSGDGKTLAGDASQGGLAAPFSLERKGEAQVMAVPKNARIAPELEGTWNGALDLGERTMRIVLKLANQPGGGAAGTIMSPDGSGVEIPIAIANKASEVKLDVPSIGASFVGVLKEAELSGSWTQQASTLPLVFRRTEK